MKRKSTVFVQKILWKTTFFVRKIYPSFLDYVRDLERWETSKFQVPAFPGRATRTSEPSGTAGFTVMTFVKGCI